MRECVRVLVGVELVAERRKAAKADVEDHAERPDVYGACVSTTVSLLENLWCDVGRRAAERGCEGFLADDLGQTEVSELDTEVLVEEEDVLGFDISVDDVALVLDLVSTVQKRVDASDLRDTSHPGTAERRPSVSPPPTASASSRSS